MRQPFAAIVFGQIGGGEHVVAVQGVVMGGRVPQVGAVFSTVVGEGVKGDVDWGGRSVFRASAFFFEDGHGDVKEVN